MTDGALAERPLTGLSVQARSEHPGVAVAAQWLSWLGAAGDAPAVNEATATLPDVVLLGDGSAAPEGVPAVMVTQPAGIEPDDAVALWARSGLAWLSRVDAPEADPDARCWPHVPIPQHLTGVTAALLASAATLAGRAGLATSTTVDQLEVLAVLPMLPFASAQVPFSPDGPGAGAVGGAVGGTMRAADGAVYLRLVEPGQWTRLLTHVPGGEATARRIEVDVAVLDRDAAEIDGQLRSWVRTMTTDALLEAGRVARAPIAPYRAVDELRNDAQLVARGFAGPGGTGRRLPWRVDAWQPAARARRCPRHAPAPDAPLRGVRVLDLTWAWAGPFATTLLAELGAEVINIEWHPRPSNLRVQQPLVPGHGVQGSAWWSANQRGKRSVALDLKTAEGRAAVVELAAVSDAVIENFSPRVVDRLGIGFDDLVAVNDAVVYVSMSAYGATGPRSSELGYGPHLYATAGFADAIRSTAGEPSQMAFPIADPISGLVGALALVAELTQPDAVHVDVSELEATCAMLGDGRLVDVRTVPATATLTDVLADPDLVGGGFWALDRAEAMAGRDVRLARAPWTFCGRRPPEPTPAPHLGRDTRPVLTQILGWDDRRVDDLVAAGGAIAAS